MPHPASADACPRTEHAARLDRIDEIALLGEPLTHLGLRVAMLELFAHVAAFVRKFYKKFGHFGNCCRLGGLAQV